MAETSSLHCLSFRILYQHLHSLNAWTPVKRRFFSLISASSHPLPKTLLQSKAYRTALRQPDQLHLEPHRTVLGQRDFPSKTGEKNLRTNTGSPRKVLMVEKMGEKLTGANYFAYFSKKKSYGPRGPKNIKKMACKRYRYEDLICRYKSFVAIALLGGFQSLAISR